MDANSPRNTYRSHVWRNLFCRLEALRCVHAAEDAWRRGQTDDAELWSEALQVWIGRDGKLRSGGTESSRGGEQPDKVIRHLEPVCDLFGVRRHLSYFGQGNGLSFSNVDFTEPEDDGTDGETTREGVHAQNLLAILTTLERYEASGQFTAKELFAVRKAWLEGWSLARIAQSEGVTRQAIRERIAGNRHGQGGVLKKAPEFATWWTFRHRNRRRGRKESRS